MTHNAFKEVILSKFIEKDGYEVVGISKNGKKKMCKVHRLVAISFISNPENKLLVNHKNCDKKDNNIENLEWATDSDNVLHALKNNRRGMPTPFFKGKKGKIPTNKRSIYCIKEDKIINFSSLVEAMNYFNVSRNRVYFACRENRTIYGFTFYYKQ